MNHYNHRESSYLRAYKAPVVCPLSSVICLLSTVQRNTIYELLRTKLSTNYAKQTQFPKKSNERKSI